LAEEDLRRCVDAARIGLELREPLEDRLTQRRRPADLFEALPHPDTALLGELFSPLERSQAPAPGRLGQGEVSRANDGSAGEDGRSARRDAKPCAAATLGETLRACAKKAPVR
jgi:hypothetical protein